MVGCILTVWHKISPSSLPGVTPQKLSIPSPPHPADPSVHWSGYSPDTCSAAAAVVLLQCT
jgi:hypothetical protein